MDTKLIKTVKMFGPSISDPSRIVNRDVPERDIAAYKAAGYQLGSVEPEPIETQPEAAEQPAEAITKQVKPKGKAKK